MSRVPDLLVEKLLLGELPAEQAAAVRARLADANELSRLDVHDDVGPLPTRVRDDARPPARTWGVAVLVASVAAALYSLPP